MKKMIFAAMAISLSGAAFAAPAESDHTVSAGFITDGSGNGTGTWTVDEDGVISITETQTTSVTGVVPFLGEVLLSNVTTTHTLELTPTDVLDEEGEPTGEVTWSGTSTVTECTNNGGLQNGCSELDIDVAFDFDSVTELAPAAPCNLQQFETVSVNGSVLGDVTTTSVYTRLYE